MRGLLLALLLLGACKGGEDTGRNGSASSGDSSSGSATRSELRDEEGEGGPFRLTGLWEAGKAPRRSQLCMIGEGDSADFALIVSSESGSSCAGAGKAKRSGDRLTLTMAGDRSCSIEARLEGSAVLMPASVSAGCAYYCAEGARLTGIRFARSGPTRADALKARDPAGDPLCG